MGRFNPIQLALLGAAAALAVALIFSSMEDEASAEPVGAPPAAQSHAAAKAESWSVGEPEDEPAPDKPTRYEFPEHTGATRTVRFAKALILTLPRAKQRQASVRKNLARYKLPPVEFVDAVDRGALKEGCDTVPDERGRPGWRPGKPPGWLTFATPCLQRRIDAGVHEWAADQMPHGHVAITLTWIKALRRVATMGEQELADDEMVYLFEDDVRVINMAPGTDLTTMRGVPSDVELLDLGKGATAVDYTREGGGTFFHTFGGALVHALALSRRGAQKALAVFEPSFYATIDVILLSHLAGFKFEYTTRWSESATGSATPMEFKAIFEKNGYDYMAKKRDIIGYTLEPCIFAQTSFSSAAQCKVHTKPLDWGTKGSKTQQHGKVL